MITPGIDSICTYFYILENVFRPGMDLELIHIGLSPLYHEIEAARLKEIEYKYLKHRVRYLDAKSIRMIIQEDADAFIPSRNLILATMVDCTAIPDRRYATMISFGFNSDDRVYDSSDVYCKTVSSILSPNVYMGSFVRHLTKSELLRWFMIESSLLSYVEKTGLINNTYSCYSGNEDECLKCNACFRKNVALSMMGIVRPFNDLNFLEKRMGILNDDSVSVDRKRNIISYISDLVSHYDSYSEFSKYIKEI